MAGSDEITALLRQLSSGDLTVEPRLLSLLYTELKKMARACLRGERPEHTLQPTALVHEAYFKLVHQDGIEWKDRDHFFAMAARAMRRVLVDYARARKAQRRGDGRVRVPLEERFALTDADHETILAVNEALDRLQKLDARQAHIVELRFFGGLTEEETAQLLGISGRTVKRDWVAARAWLHAELSAASVRLPKPR